MLRKKLFWALLALAIAFASCTICHTYGPFMGKVVDAKTGLPIKGAVVLIGFHTMAITPGGWSWSFADAIETTTDDKGEFRIPPKFVNSFRIFAVWDDDCKLSIFKPGFGAFPEHPQTFCEPNLNRARIIPENEYVTYYLPKLHTLEEREKNLMKISVPGGITTDKMQRLRKMEREEYKYVFGP